MMSLNGAVHGAGTETRRPFYRRSCLVVLEVEAAGHASVCCQCSSEKPSLGWYGVMRRVPLHSDVCGGNFVCGTCEEIPGKATLFGRHAQARVDEDTLWFAS